MLLVQKQDCFVPVCLRTYTETSPVGVTLVSRIEGRTEGKRIWLRGTACLLRGTACLLRGTACLLPRRGEKIKGLDKIHNFKKSNGARLSAHVRVHNATVGRPEGKETTWKI